MIPNYHITKLRNYFDDNKILYEVRFWEVDRYNIHVVREYKTISFVTSVGSYGGLEGLIEAYNFSDEPTGFLTTDEAIEFYKKEVEK